MLTGVSLASCRAQSSAFIAGTDNISVLSTAQKMTPNRGHITPTQNSRLRIGIGSLNTPGGRTWSRHGSISHTPSRLEPVWCSGSHGHSTVGSAGLRPHATDHQWKRLRAAFPTLSRARHHRRTLQRRCRFRSARPEWPEGVAGEVSARPNAQMRGPAGSSLCSNSHSGRCGHPSNKPENLIQQNRTLSANVLDNGWYVNIHCQTHLPKGYNIMALHYR